MTHNFSANKFYNVFSKVYPNLKPSVLVAKVRDNGQLYGCFVWTPQNDISSMYDLLWEASRDYRGGYCSITNFVRSLLYTRSGEFYLEETTEEEYLKARNKDSLIGELYK